MKNKEAFRDAINEAIANYANEYKDNNFIAEVIITVDDGWAGCNILKERGYEDYDNEEQIY